MLGDFVASKSQFSAKQKEFMMMPFQMISPIRRMEQLEPGEVRPAPIMKMVLGEEEKEPGEVTLMETSASKLVNESEPQPSAAIKHKKKKKDKSKDRDKSKEKDSSKHKEKDRDKDKDKERDRDKDRERERSKEKKHKKDKKHDKHDKHEKKKHKSKKHDLEKSETSGISETPLKLFTDEEHGVKQEPMKPENITVSFFCFLFKNIFLQSN